MNNKKVQLSVIRTSLIKELLLLKQTDSYRSSNFRISDLMWSYDKIIKGFKEGDFDPIQHAESSLDGENTGPVKAYFVYAKAIEAGYCYFEEEEDCLVRYLISKLEDIESRRYF